MHTVEWTLTLWPAGDGWWPENRASDKHDICWEKNNVEEEKKTRNSWRVKVSPVNICQPSKIAYKGHFSLKGILIFFSQRTNDQIWKPAFLLHLFTTKSLPLMWHQSKPPQCFVFEATCSPSVYIQLSSHVSAVQHMKKEAWTFCCNCKWCTSGYMFVVLLFLHGMFLCVFIAECTGPVLGASLY